MKHMIRNTKSFTALLLVLVMVLALPVMAYADTTASADLTITGVQSGEQFQLWKIVDISYDSATNTVAYSFNSAFAAYFAGKGVTIEDFMDSTQYGNNSSELNALLAGLPAAGGSGTACTASGTTITVENLAAGGYFVKPVAFSRIYQPMMTYIAPEVENGEYVYKDREYAIKSKDAAVTKQVSVNGSDFADADTIQTKSLDKDGNAASTTAVFKITIDVPAYDSAVSVPTLKIEDSLPTGLSYKGNVTVTGVAEGGAETTLDSTVYSLTASESSDTVTLDFAGHYDDVKAYQKIVVTYEVTADEDLAVKTANSSTVTYSYTSYPYVSTAADAGVLTKTAAATLYTYGLKLTKQSSDATPVKLANAVFSLYRKPVSSDEAASKVSIKTDASGTVMDAVLVAEGLTTDSNGQVSLTGLADAEYYLVETKAPSGYQLDPVAKKCDLSSGMTEDADGYYELTITNEAASLVLPQTGATGLVIFSFLGLAVMVCAVGYLVICMRRKQK